MMKYLLLAVVAMASGLGACSDDNNLQRREVPELSIEGTDGNFNIKLPVVDDKPEKQIGILTLRNTGKANLTVTKLAWVAKPDRLDALAAPGGECQTDDQCGGGELCLTSRCFTLASGDALRNRTGVAQGHRVCGRQGRGELQCPTPGADVPESYINSYCGEMVIETDAINNAGVVVEGKAKLYFLKPNASGRIEVQPEFMEFQNIQPGCRLRRILVSETREPNR
ncbi:MAG: hypothetical protein R3E66_15450 [bacterium]